MLRPLALLTFTLATTLGAVAARAESRTTQIEDRPTYGATITIEEGVRVFRPLPGDRHVVVNPNRTPLVLDASNGDDGRVINQSIDNSTIIFRKRHH